MRTIKYCSVTLARISDRSLGLLRIFIVRRISKSLTVAKALSFRRCVLLGKVNCKYGGPSPSRRSFARLFVDVIVTEY